MGSLDSVGTAFSPVSSSAFYTSQGVINTGVSARAGASAGASASTSASANTEINAGAAAKAAFDQLYTIYIYLITSIQPKLVEILETTSARVRGWVLQAISYFNTFMVPYLIQLTRRVSFQFSRLRNTLGSVVMTLKTFDYWNTTSAGVLSVRKQVTNFKALIIQSPLLPFLARTCSVILSLLSKILSISINIIVMMKNFIISCLFLIPRVVFGIVFISFRAIFWSLGAFWSVCQYIGNLSIMVLYIKPITYITMIALLVGAGIGVVAGSAIVGVQLLIPYTKPKNNSNTQNIDDDNKNISDTKEALKKLLASPTSNFQSFGSERPLYHITTDQQNVPFPLTRRSSLKSSNVTNENGINNNNSYAKRRRTRSASVSFSKPLTISVENGYMNSRQSKNNGDDKIKMTEKKPSIKKINTRFSVSEPPSPHLYEDEDGYYNLRSAGGSLISSTSPSRMRPSISLPVALTKDISGVNNNNNDRRESMTTLVSPLSASPSSASHVVPLSFSKDSSEIINGNSQGNTETPIRIISNNVGKKRGNGSTVVTTISTPATPVTPVIPVTPATPATTQTTILITKKVINGEENNNNDSSRNHIKLMMRPPHSRNNSETNLFGLYSPSKSSSNVGSGVSATVGSPVTSTGPCTSAGVGAGTGVGTGVGVGGGSAISLPRPSSITMTNLWSPLESLSGQSTSNESNHNRNSSTSSESSSSSMSINSSPPHTPDPESPSSPISYSPSTSPSHSTIVNNNNNNDSENNEDSFLLYSIPKNTSSPYGTYNNNKGSSSNSNSSSSRIILTTTDKINNINKSIRINNNNRNENINNNNLENYNNNVSSSPLTVSKRTSSLTNIFDPIAEE